MYYTYTGCITFEPLGSENVEPPQVRSSSDTQFRGCPCSMKEMYNLASEVWRTFESPQRMLMSSMQLGYNQLMDLVTSKMLPSITPENAVEEIFPGSLLCVPLVMTSRCVINNWTSPPRVIDRGLEIICSPEHRTDRRIHSQLREILGEAATGSRLSDFDTFSAYLDKLHRP